MSNGYKRILLKVSGESLKSKNDPAVIDPVACEALANSVCEIYETGVQIGLVVGGGNIFRGSHAEAFGFARTPADHVGMLAITINGLILGQILSTKGCKVRVMSALNLDGIVEKYNWNHAMHALEKGHIVIFVGGTGNPYFTTDTTAALRASEMGAEVVLKGTKVDGIYTEDPAKSSKAKKIETLSFDEALRGNYQVMDQTAIALCRENQIPIHVFNIFTPGALAQIVKYGTGGTLVGG
ncbi:UMP kinase [Candidatus Aerophobetes bacterium]|uniref:Uridylate kinase n=1 Tax=Aerophobetes bacterium TaxID=2030807 RepID=A0A2A4X587_UNCAE|nr:MAG: UMP kinase [Candidatus Aerophobetes bacterium]